MKRKLRNPALLFLIILFLWSIYRYFTRFPEWADDFIGKPILWLIPALFFVRILEKKPLTSIGFVTKYISRNIIIGIIVGMFLAAELVVTRLLSHTTMHLERITFYAVLFNMLSSLATGIVEEIVFRGYIQTRLSKAFSVRPAIGISSFLFVLSHFPLIIFVYHYSFIQTLNYSLLIFILGIVNGYVFYKTKSLVSPIIMHTVWDFVSWII